jgi:hypothetical protein
VDFQGFQFVLPAAVVVVLMAAFYGLAWLAYRKFHSMPAYSRWGLIFLRGTALSFLLLLLLNPYFYSSREVEVKPTIAVFLDHSESVGISKGAYRGVETYQSVLDELNFQSIDEANIDFYSFGVQVAPTHPDSLTASEAQTNLSDPVKSILEMKEDVQAAVILSDGIITFGRNPSINAFNSSIPLYTIALGDTSKVRDIAVSNVFTNPVGYTNTQHVIEAEISAAGFKNNQTTVSLLSGGEVLQQQQIEFSTNDQVKQLQFKHELKEKGLKQFEIRTESITGEWSLKNNRQFFSINVLDSKVKILDVAFEIHPDVKAIRRVIAQDRNNELTTLTWLGGDAFVEELPGEKDFNLIIIHGLPTSNRDFSFLDNLRDTPSILFEEHAAINPSFNAYEVLALIKSSSAQVSKTTLSPLLSSDEQPILEVPNINYAEAPPFLSPLRSALIKPQSTTLYAINYDGLKTDSPAMAVLEQGNIRRAHVLPWGWFRMLQSTNPSHREFATALLSNLVSWTSSNPDNRKLRISPSKQTFSTAEKPLINASLINERGDAENEGIIEIQLSSREGTARTFNMDNTGNGNYRLNLPRLSEGLYSYTATARKGERELETQQGEFLVSNSSSELANTTRNDELLASISENSGGAFFTYPNASSLWDSLENAQVLKPRTETLENYTFPVRFVYWFVIVLLFLGTEWVIRKYYSLP